MVNKRVFERITNKLYNTGRNAKQRRKQTTQNRKTNTKKEPPARFLFY